MRALVAVLCAGLLLAGCVEDSSPPDGGSADDGQGAQDEGAGGASAVGGSTSAGVERTESKIQTGQSNDQWFARQTVILKNDASGGSGDASFETVSGGVEVVARSGSDYQITVSLEGRGDSEQQALDRLEDLGVVHTDEGSWTLATRVTNDNDRWNGQTGAIHASIPASSWDSLLAKTVSGGVSVTGHTADDLEARAVSGGVSCSDVSASSLTLHTESGGIDCDATADDVEISATLGSIDVALEADASGDWELSTTSGGIELTAPEDGQRGYDITAHATSGGVDFDFQDTQVVSAKDDSSGESRHERTNSFSSRSIQTTVDLEVVSGGIEAGS